MKNFIEASDTKSILSSWITGAVAGVVALTGATPSIAASQPSSSSVLLSGATQSFTSSFLHQLDFASVGTDANGLTLGGDGKLYATTVTGGANQLGSVFRVDSSGGFELVHAFTASEGGPWYNPLVRGPDGSLYGTTTGRAYESGTFYNTASTVYRIDPHGNYQILHSFAPVTNAYPAGPGRVGVAADGTVYGIEAQGGPDGSGVAFKIDAAGTYTPLHVFSDSEPFAIFAVSADGNMYGLSSDGLARITPDGRYSVTSPGLPRSAAPGPDALLSGVDGEIYGYFPNIVSDDSTIPGNGYVFHVNAAGEIEPLYTPLSGGADIYVELKDMVAGKDGNLYAAQIEYRTRLSGIRTATESIVQIAPSGRHKVLHRFDAPTVAGTCRYRRNCYDQLSSINWDGESPELRAGEDGAIYGNTFRGGAAGRGTAFKLTPDGRFTLLGTASWGIVTSNEYFVPGEFAFPQFVGDDGHGHLFGWIVQSVNPFAPVVPGIWLYRLSSDGPMTISASFTPSAAAPGQAVTLNWTASGATYCWLDTDIAGASGLLSATTGSFALTPNLPVNYPVSRVDNWVANVQCVAADGSVSGFALKLPRKLSSSDS